MRIADEILRRWRIAVALRWLRDGDRLLDVGCYDRKLIDAAGARIAGAWGVDPRVEAADDGRVRLVPARFGEDLAIEAESFDCITGTAVLEHIRDPAGFARECERVLRPGGRLVLTVPRPAVDYILHVLVFVGLADGMSTDQHHGFRVESTVPIFSRAGLRLVRRRSFQLGFNQLFVFEKPTRGDAARDR